MSLFITSLTVSSPSCQIQRVIIEKKFSPAEMFIDFREVEREIDVRNINWLSPVCTPTGDWNHSLFGVHRMTPQATWATQPGLRRSPLWSSSYLIFQQDSTGLIISFGNIFFSQPPTSMTFIFLTLTSERWHVPGLQLRPSLAYILALDELTQSMLPTNLLHSEDVRVHSSVVELKLTHTKPNSLIFLPTEIWFFSLHASSSLKSPFTFLI